MWPVSVLKSKICGAAIESISSIHNICIVEIVVSLTVVFQHVISQKAFHGKCLNKTFTAVEHLSSSANSKTQIENKPGSPSMKN